MAPGQAAVFYGVGALAGRVLGGGTITGGTITGSHTLNVLDFRDPVHARLMLFNDTSHYAPGPSATPEMPHSRLSCCARPCRRSSHP